MMFSKPGWQSVSAFKFVTASLIAVISIFASGTVLAGDYAGTQQAQAFAQRMAEQHGFDASKVVALLGEANRQQSILDAIARPAEKSKPWYQYRDIFLDDQRINGGVTFWQQHQEALLRAEETFGVSPEIIVAIIGVETRYGAVTGNYRVLDALATLGFDYPPRAAFFNRELEQFLLLTREQQQNPRLLKGSYAGAMGYGQFMPSSYRAYATDFDGDQTIDIWSNPVDAIGSVGNYFKVHGWQAGAAVMIPAQVGGDYDPRLLNQVKKPQLGLTQLSRAGFNAAYADQSQKAIPLSFESRQGQEFWLGFQNFYVITRYNRSPLYARAVWELSREIADRHQTVMSASM
jgi:membrane-bound lytic murein transglycosylase B